MLEGWLTAFNATNPSAYRKFIAAHMPGGLPYVDDDLAVKDASGGLQLLRWEVSGDNQITGWLKDRSWDRFSKVIVTAESDQLLSDIGFRGAPTPNGFTIPRLDQSEAIRAFRTKLETESGAGRFSGAALVATADDILFRQAFGMANIADKVAADDTTRFCIGSMGKMFTAVATLQLVQSGQIGLQEKIAAYLPAYPNQDLARQVTVEQLLAHTGGTGDIFGPQYDGHSAAFRSPEQFIKLYGDRPLAFEPGSKWSYSNYGYILLGAIIERATQQSYEIVFENAIFRPLGMHMTSGTAELPAPAATSYSGALATGLKPVAPYYGTPAGGGYSTIDDFLAFARGIQSGRLLDAEHTALLTIGRVDTGNGKYSLGMSVMVRNGVTTYGHGGSAPGANGDFSVYPQSGYVAIVLCNRGYPLALNAANYVGSRLPTAMPST